MAGDQDATDAEIARLLAADNPEQFYEYHFGEQQEPEDDDSDVDPGYGGEGGKRFKKGKKKQRPGEGEGDAAGGGVPVLPAIAGYDPAAAAAYAVEPAAHAPQAADPTAAAGAMPDMSVNGGGMQGAGMSGGPLPALAMSHDHHLMQHQMMMQQQALAAALAGGGGGGMTGLQIALPPGVSLEQASLMGLPIMAMPVQLPPGSSGGAPHHSMHSMHGMHALPKMAPHPGMGMQSMHGLPALAPGLHSGHIVGASRPPSASAARSLAAAAAVDDEFTATGRRKRKDTGKQRQQSRSWTDDEERLFVEALQMYGRDWKRCAEHVGSRDHRAFTSHAQKHFIKLLLRGEEVPSKVAETGRGYTLSGKALDPNSAAARAYGLKPDLFLRIAHTGKLIVGVHVSTLDMSDGPPPQIQRQRGGKSPAGGGGGGGGMKRQRRTKGAGSTYNSGAETEEEDEDAFLASVMQAEIEPAEPTEYVRNRPRRQVGRRMQMGETTESTDLTHLEQFVGPAGTGAPLSQPFQVTIDSQALVVMDFHSHLSRCEIIGLLGGTFDADRRVLEIKEAYPCRRAEGLASGTSVELDAESQVEVSCLMEERGQVPVGWYHSHPVFEPRPSQKDNENQRNYQALCRDAASGMEPWVGAIVGPYDQGLESASSQVQMWLVRMHNGVLKPYNVRAVPTGAGALPTDRTERALEMALDQLEDDIGRVDLSELWRPYSRLRMQQPEGPPLSKIQKLRDSLASHLPVAEKPLEVAGFLDRVQRQIEARWRVQLPQAAPLQVPAPPVVVAMPPPGTLGMPLQHALPQLAHQQGGMGMGQQQQQQQEHHQQQEEQQQQQQQYHDHHHNQHQQHQQQDEHTQALHLLGGMAAAGGAELAGVDYAAQQQAYSDMLHS